MSILSDFRRIRARIEIPSFLRVHGLNGRICEVGVRYGYHLRQLLTCNPRTAIGVDLWRDDGNKAHNDTGINQRSLDGIYQDVFHQFLGDPRVKLFRGYSDGAARCVDNQSLDFCYIDADHTFEGCRDDLNRWWMKVRQGGLFAGHDFFAGTSAAGTPFGVIQAVAELRKTREIPDKYFHVTTCGYKTWLILKVDGE